MARRAISIRLLTAVLGSALALALALQLLRRERETETPSGEATLRSGAPLETVLAGGASRRYSIPLAAGRYLRVEVMQDGVDAILRLLASDGSLLVESDGVNGRQGPESVSLVSDRAAVYTLEVRAAESVDQGEPGRLSLRVAEEGKATPRNHRRVAADWKAAAARQLFFEHKPGTDDRVRRDLAAAVQEFRLADDPVGEADGLFALAVVEDGQERFSEALEPLGRALELVRSLEDPRREAEVLWLRGRAYWRLGEWRLAVDDLARVAPLYRTLGDSARQARTLSLLALIYLEVGDYRRAPEYAGAALRAARPLGDSRELAEALNVQASAGLFQGDPAPALPLLEEALAMGRRLGYRDTEVANLISLGVALRQLGRLEEARARLYEAQAIGRELGNLYAEVTALEQLSRTYASASDKAMRRELLERTLEASRRSGYDRGEAQSLTDLARDSLLAGDLGRARRLIEEAVAVRERQLRRVPSAALQVGYLADQFPTYELYVDVLAAIDRAGMDPRAAALAFSVVDGARARALRQELARARVEVQGEVPRRLLDRRRELARSLLLAETARRGGRADPTGIEALEAELRLVEREIAQASPRWAGLMLPEAFTVEELQRDLLDSDTVLLEYALGGDRSHVFAIDVSRVVMIELPDRATIEAAARAVTESVVARNQRVRFETEGERRERVARTDVELVAAATLLSEMVLSPVADQIAGKRLAVVADGALQYVPFGALPGPSGRGAGPPLALHHEIVHLPSASALREIRRQSAGRSTPAATLAVLADPVLRPDDPRLDRGFGVRAILASMSGGETDAPEPSVGKGTELLDLPYARDEAEAILALVPPAERLGAFGFDASRATAANLELSRYRFVHFATHASIDSGEPDLSGIELSRFDARGHAQEGLLPLYDIYDLELAADLVVLSGCRTALGKEIRGEGLIGLTRGFMFAGAPRVVVSLWDVQDRATAELMKRMYTRLLVEGERPAAALSAAQREMAADPEWSAPYYWAGFILQGDWR